MKRSWFGYSIGVASAAMISLMLGSVPGIAAQASPDAAAAASPPAAASATAAKPAPKNPVVAIVNGYKIHLSDLAKAVQSLPAEMQKAPPQELYPFLLNRLVDERALLIKARKDKFADKPEVRKAMRHAADRALEAAYLRETVKPKLSDAALKAYYQKHYVGKKQPKEVKARQILVKTKARAEKIITQLNNGAKFSALAVKDSIDPGAKNGGELGWFTKDEMGKPFADAAFALKPGTYTKTPVQSQFGWHIIESEGQRQKPVPDFDSVKGQIREKVANQAITDSLSDARKGLTVKLFNPDGTPEAASAPAKN